MGEGPPKKEWLDAKGIHPNKGTGAGGLRTNRQGLSGAGGGEAPSGARENRLKEAEKLTLFQRFVQQLKDPMLLILLAAAAVSAVTNILSHESFTEVIIILLVVLLNAFWAWCRRARRRPPLKPSRL